jgi:hypothetical protein
VEVDMQDPHAAWGILRLPWMAGERRAWLSRGLAVTFGVAGPAYELGEAECCPGHGEHDAQETDGVADEEEQHGGDVVA